MKRSHRPCRALVATVACLLVNCGARESEEDRYGPVPRLVLIGVDGGSWNLIDPMLEASELPHLAALADRGITAELTAVEPLFSPPVWTSIATGRSPEAHGVTGFFDIRHDIRVPTVWERFAAAGLAVGLYDYLVTWPPRPLPGGFMVPGWLRRDERVEPPDLFERIGLPRYAYVALGPGDLDRRVANFEHELEEKPRTFNRLVETFDVDVAAVTFYAVDTVSHNFYHTLAPEEFDPPIRTEARFHDVIPRTLRGVDRAIGEIVAALDEEDHVVVVSDHGFRADPDFFRRWAYDNAWFLSRAGVDPERDDVGVVVDFLSSSFEFRSAPRDPAGDPLKRLEAVFRDVRTAAGEAVFQVWPVREPERYLERAPPWQAEIMASRLPAHAFLFATGVPEVLDRLWPDGLVEFRGARVPVSALASAHDFTGDHHPVGIFLAAGAAVAHRPLRTRLSVLDVAPLLSYLAGQPIADDLEGRLDASWIEPDYLARRPPRRVAAAEAPRLAAESDAPAGGEDEEVKKRLRALGYIR